MTRSPISVSSYASCERLTRLRVTRSMFNDELCVWIELDDARTSIGLPVDAAETLRSALGDVLARLNALDAPDCAPDAELPILVLPEGGAR